MRWVFLAMVFLVGCGSDDASDDRTFDELFDEATAMYCTEGPMEECRDLARLAVSFAATDDISREDILTRMVDDLEPAAFPGFEEAMWESVRGLMFDR